MNQTIFHRRQKSFTEFEQAKRDIRVAQDILRKAFRVNGNYKPDGFKKVLACQNSSFNKKESSCLEECLSFREGSAPISFDCPCLFFEKRLKKVNLNFSLRKIQELNVSSLNYVDVSKNSPGAIVITSAFFWTSIILLLSLYFQDFLLILTILRIMN